MNETAPGAMYPASLMSRPDYGGKVIRTLETGKTYVVLGQVEHLDGAGR